MQEWECVDCGITQSFHRQCKYCFSRYPHIKEIFKTKVIKPKVLPSLHIKSKLNNAIISQNDEIIVVSQEFYDKKTRIRRKVHNAQINIYDTRLNEWSSLEIPSIDECRSLGNCSSSPMIIQLKQRYTKNMTILLLYGLIRLHVPDKYMPQELCVLCMKFSLSTHIKLDLFYNSGPCWKSELDIFSVVIKYHKFEEFIKCKTIKSSPEQVITSSKHMLVSIGNKYHAINGKYHFCWDRQNPWKIDIIYCFRFEWITFHARGLIYVSRTNMLLMIAEYDSNAFSANTVWRYSFEDGIWNKYLDLPDYLYEIGYCLTNNEKYLVIIGRVAYGENKQVLILNTIKMQWIEELIELEIPDDGDINVVITSNNDIHILYSNYESSDYCKSHYMVSFNDIIA